MTKTDLYIAYQKESGLSLGLIKSISEYPDVIPAECDDCGASMDVVENEELIAYIRWLEQEVISRTKDMEKIPYLMSVIEMMTKAM